MYSCWSGSWNIDDEKTIDLALTGFYGKFLVIDFASHFAKKEGINTNDSATKSGVSHSVFSESENGEKF